MTNQNHDFTGRLVTRLPFPEADAKDRGIAISEWNALLSEFRGVTDPASILMAYDWAKARGLVAVQGHVNIISQKTSVRLPSGKYEDRYVDEVWLTQRGLLHTAHATGTFAGMDEVEFGPEITETFKGRARRDGTWKDVSKDVTYPKWAKITVYRIVSGHKAAFPAILYFKESVARTGNMEANGNLPAYFGVPTRIWADKPFMMLRKCAVAAALREAFPTLDFTVDEMAGREVAEVIVTEAPIANPETGSEPSNVAPSTEGARSDEPARIGGESAQRPVENERARSFGQLDLETLEWIARQNDAALSTGGFDAARAHMTASLDPRFLGLGESVLAASRAIQDSPKAGKVGPWLDRAIGSLPRSYDQAVTHISNQLRDGGIDTAMAEAMTLIIDFQGALATARDTRQAA
ncbi:MAG: hypothetical protein DI556_13520 [Rhodovulum sulfidophilum]|uniref:Phage recombination protein Bet n=1 Tax=Rhodovulum sulfidophilum TaxID=35806 RepID=A0A2W5N972_RHOSU|nr:MAG: hypothetical protein DI556_13520 [Rhodovulum sulfidophilum]